MLLIDILILVRQCYPMKMVPFVDALTNLNSL